MVGGVPKHPNTALAVISPSIYVSSPNKKEKTAVLEHKMERSPVP